MNKKKLYGTIIAVILFAILIIGATYAWLIYSFNATNGVYNTSTECFTVLSENSGDISGSLNFSLSPNDESLEATITIGLSQSCDITAYGQIIMEILDTTSTVLYTTPSAHCENFSTLQTLTNYDNNSTCTSNSGIWVTNGSALKYRVINVLPSSDTVVAVGYIKNSGTITLYENFELTNGSIETIRNEGTYKIQIWLDGELINNTYNNTTFSGYIYARANQVDY